jgi:hypothetical protein
LFPTVKEKLEWIQLADEDQFSECLQEVLSGLDQQELNRVFQAWVGRLQEVSEDNGDYVRRRTIYICKSSAHSHQTGLAHVLIDQTIAHACCPPINILEFPFTATQCKKAYTFISQYLKPIIC